MDQAVLDLSRAVEAHPHYVAISRLRDSKGLHIIDLNEHAIKIDQFVKEEMERSRNISSI